MRSVQLDRIYAIAEQIVAEANRKPLKSLLSKFNRSVLIWLDDGSHFYFNNAFVETYENEDGIWYIIIPEHHNLTVYHKDDVELIKQFRPGEIKIRKSTWKPKLKVIK